MSHRDYDYSVSMPIFYREVPMAKSVNGKPKNKMQAVRQILQATPQMTGSEIATAMKSQVNLAMTPKVASTYRYHILGKQRRAQRKAVRALAGPQGRTVKTDGLDHLLRAAEKLGWKRVK